MAAGFAHIFALSASTDSEGIRRADYQFTFTDGRNSYARTFDEPHLIEILIEELAFPPETVDTLLAELRDKGHVTIPDLVIPENEAVAIGFSEAPSDV